VAAAGRSLKLPVLGVLGAIAVGSAVLTMAEIGMQVPAAPASEVTRQKPFVDYIGREYRVVGDVSASAWNDFPDKSTLRSITLSSPDLLVRNRFVSFVKRLNKGQTVRLLSAWTGGTHAGLTHHYRVELPGAGLPEGVPTELGVTSDGLPNPTLYQRVEK
jgi:hypothetical protein